MSSEYEDTILLANRVLDRPGGDPDDDLAMLARQFLRAVELTGPLRAELMDALTTVGLIEDHGEDFVEMYKMRTDKGGELWSVTLKENVQLCGTGPTLRAALEQAVAAKHSKERGDR